MRYLQVIHIPVGRGSAPGRIKVPDLWLADIRPQVRALGADARLVIACPLVESLAGKSAAFNEIEINPEDEGFEHVPLPHYNSMRGYLQNRRAIAQRIAEAMQNCTMLHTGYGGHPVPVGQIAWPIAKKMGRKRLWNFDGADPFPRMQLNIDADTNSIRRFFKRRHYRNFVDFCRQAIVNADLVFAHNQAVVDRFKDVWNERCFSFDRTFVTDEMLTPPAELERRWAEIEDATRPLRLVVAGRQIKIKGTDQILRAMKFAKEQNVALHLDVWGDGADLPIFQSLTEELGLSDCVRFRGTIAYGPALFAELLKSQVMLVTNLTAEISRNVMISMALGLPLIIYRNPGTDKLVTEHDAGILVDTGNVESLARTLIDVSRDRAKLVRVARNGQRLAEINTLQACHTQRIQLVKRFCM